MKKHKINKWGQIVERDETDDGLGRSVSPWLVLFIRLFVVLGIVFSIFRYLIKQFM
jgi:hypothetical protein